MPARTDLLLKIGLGVLLSLCIACERQQPGQREQQAELRQSKQHEQPLVQTKPGALPVEQSAAARRALVAWFECEECADNELERVVGYGELVVPNLAATLQGGLSPSKRAEIQQHLQDTYRALAEYAKEHKDSSLQMSEQEYLATYLETLNCCTNCGQPPHSVTLAPAAREALERSLALKELRPDVRRGIERALKREVNPPPRLQ